MIADSAVLGIDLGTSSVKVVLADGHGHPLAQVTRDYPVDRPHPGWAETDPDAWWSAIRSGVAEVLTAAPGAVPSGIGLSGQMHGVVLADASAVAVRPAVLWADARAADELSLYRALPADVLARQANPLFPGMFGPELAWLTRHEGETVAAARWALSPKDWVRARLTGAIAGEPSDASATLLFDVLTGDWDDDVVAALGIRRDLLPDLLPSAGTIAGHLLPGVAADLGLSAGTPVAAGAGDSAAAALGSGLFRTGDVQLTIGTGVQIVTPVPAPSAQSLPGPSPVTHLYRAATRDGWYAMAAGLTGGQTLDWVRRMLAVDWVELYAAADHQPRPDDPIFVPHLVGERTPHLDSSLRGSWTGLAAHHTRRDLMYSALEGVAFAVAESLDALSGNDSGHRDLRLAGGGTVSAAWRSLLADVLRARLHAVDVPGASARGAALLGAQAAGLVDDDSLPGVAAVRTTLIAEPGHRASLLAERREQYRRRFDALR